MVKFQHPNYIFSFDAKRIVDDLIYFKEHIYDPFIMNTGTLNNQLFEQALKIETSLYIHNSIHDLLKQLTGKFNLWDICDIAFNKDEEWGEWRNKELLYRAFHKYTLKDEFAEKIIPIIDEWIEEVQSIYQQMKQQEEKRKAEKESRYNKFSIVKVFEMVEPQGGEDGQDGYFDVSLQENNTGETVRVVARNVFDFGFYTYPKRFEGTEDIFNKSLWTETEKEVCQWLQELSPFTTRIRM